MNAKPEIFKCEECGLHYEDAKIAEQCAAWCKEYMSCSLEITQYSVERQQNQA